MARPDQLSAVLITRPEPGAAETAAACAALGWDAILASALLLRATPQARLPPAQAILLASPRGARITIALLRRAGLADALRSMRAIATSPRIAEALSAMPWAAIETTARPDAALLPGHLGSPSA